MKICKRHLNWTLLLGTVAVCGILLISLMISIAIGIYDNAALLLYIVASIAQIWLHGWYLCEKNRSLVFLLLSPVILLLLANKSDSLRE